MNAYAAGRYGQHAPLEAIAKQFTVKQEMAENLEDSSNELFETLEEWEAVLKADKSAIRELSR